MEIEDSDADGLADPRDACPRAAEIVNGNEDLDGCPDDGESAIVLETDRIELREKVRFESQASHVLDDTSFPVLDQVVALLRLRSTLRIRIEAHDDASLPDEHGLRLSDARAKSVARYLVEHGVAVDRIESRGFGDTRPLTPGRTAEERERNSRIEIWLR
jgi:outer membrane protein OmpA-like peptidoglycan-associated protein